MSLFYRWKRQSPERLRVWPQVTHKQKIQDLNARVLTAEPMLLTTVREIICVQCLALWGITKLPVCCYASSFNVNKWTSFWLMSDWIKKWMSLLKGEAHGWQKNPTSDGRSGGWGIGGMVVVRVPLHQINLVCGQHHCKPMNRTLRSAPRALPESTMGPEWPH